MEKSFKEILYEKFTEEATKAKPDDCIVREVCAKCFDVHVSCWDYPNWACQYHRLKEGGADK